MNLWILSILLKIIKRFLNKWLKPSSFLSSLKEISILSEKKPPLFQKNFELNYNKRNFNNPFTHTTSVQSIAKRLLCASFWKRRTQTNSHIVSAALYQPNRYQRTWHTVLIDLRISLLIDLRISIWIDLRMSLSRYEELSSDERNCRYQPLPRVDMEDYFRDENKFVQLPWEDPMYV